MALLFMYKKMVNVSCSINIIVDSAKKSQELLLYYHILPLAIL